MVEVPGDGDINGAINNSDSLESHGTFNKNS